jgi:hypothetical protein
MTDLQVVILGRTVAEAKHWQEVWKVDYPELEKARAVGTYSARSLEGLIVHKLFIAPDAEQGPNYQKVYEVLKRALNKGRPDWTMVFLGRK